VTPAQAQAIAPQLEQGRQELAELALLCSVLLQGATVTAGMARVVGLPLGQLVDVVSGINMNAVETVAPIAANAVNVSGRLIERAARGDAQAAVSAARIIVSGRDAVQTALDTIDVRVVGARFIDEVVVPSARSVAKVGIGVGGLLLVGAGLYAAWRIFGD
jgi:hypothetical protein